ncbi:20327_t:CDS:2, partial [Racocetra persica]
QKQTQVITNEQKVSPAKDILPLIKDQSGKDNNNTSLGEVIPEVSVPSTSISRNTKLGKSEISAGAPLPKNSHRKKGAENISQMISDGIRDNTYPQNSISDISNDLLLQQNQISSLVLMLTLAQLFDKATIAEYSAICANQEEILCWYYYGKEFIIQYKDIIKNSNGKIGEKKAKDSSIDNSLNESLKAEESIPTESQIS